MIVLKYFGSIAEKTAVNEERISFSNASLVKLVDALNKKYQLQDLVFSIAVNQKIIQNLDDYELKPNDIIAFLPPFSGG
ncbi:MAG TPA: MoaD/ThiS family protein [Flavobacterium sp.]|nr:MoaD/ThiS family protein [Flavobacterium sp.]